MTATELARAAGYTSYSVANVQYGKFARRLCEFLGFHPDVGKSGSPTQTYVLAQSSKLRGDDWRWTMHPVVVEALLLYERAPGELLPAERLSLYAGEVPEGKTYWEGAVEHRLVNARERSPVARAACLDYWGTSCSVCEMDASEAYGVEAARFIHVHHLLPLSSLTEPMLTDPKEHLRPVCPNCHVVLHMTEPPTSISELRTRLRHLRQT